MQSGCGRALDRVADRLVALALCDLAEYLELAWRELAKRAVEKHVYSIFVKLGLTRDEDISQRVKAALIYLGQRHPGAPPDA